MAKIKFEKNIDCGRKYCNNCELWWYKKDTVNPNCVAFNVKLKWKTKYRLLLRDQQCKDAEVKE